VEAIRVPLADDQFADERPDWARPHWDGQDLHGKSILVVREQGIGDLLQFSRYFPLLKERGARVLFRPLGGMRPIAERLPGSTSCSTTTSRRRRTTTLRSC
jgi:hypothetical protein